MQISLYKKLIIFVTKIADSFVSLKIDGNAINYSIFVKTHGNFTLMGFKEKMKF
jgi:hypothetical protein